MVKVSGVPSQSIPPLLKVGVTVTMAIIGDVPVLTAVKLGILPVPVVGLSPTPVSILQS